ncbi:acetylornithine transaminase [Dasania marina]|uniref:acetylornithine transaminase n=1 Tax=Dasania marina TaxID=471499 RepID=UPI0030DAF60D|tara:strand:- start:150397 stop:151572 length:1176 start_codon:yes stop_codon:yes gene_type:complete
MTAIMNTYGRLPVTFSHGKGVFLYDTDNKAYLDAISGIGVNALGHCHPAVSEAIKQQADTLIHTSNLYGIAKQQALAELLCDVSGMDNVFFANSGAEANEAAIKIARLHGHQQGIDSPQIIVMDNAFHGRTMATLTATGNTKVQEGFAPLLAGFIRVPFGDLAAIQAHSNNSDVVAVLMEPIQGEGGLHVLADGYLAELRAVCDNNNWLMMLDEVQTGNGRTGRYFAYQHDGILPDVVTTAKGLGNGVPIGACLAQGKAAQVLAPGNHGSTYGGNPLSCAAALAVINTIQSQQLCANATTIGQYIREGISQQLAGSPHLKEVRGKGLMIGIELHSPCTELVHRARERGVLINVTAGSVIRLLPPLITIQQDADTIINTVADIVNDFQPQNS